eukprot:1157514-Pelagomonas_calceolata.AAC.2
MQGGWRPYLQVLIPVWEAAQPHLQVLIFKKLRFQALVQGAHRSFKLHVRPQTRQSQPDSGVSMCQYKSCTEMQEYRYDTGKETQARPPAWFTLLMHTGVISGLELHLPFEYIQKRRPLPCKLLSPNYCCKQCFSDHL